MSAPKIKLSFEKARGVHQEPTKQLQKSLKDWKDNENGGVQVVLVGGSSGTGKSYLVQRALAGINISKEDDKTGQSCWYAHAKFDQKGRPTPFAAAQTIVQEITDQIIGKESDHLEACRAALKKEFAVKPTHIQVLLDTIPETSSLFVASGRRSSRGTLGDDTLDDSSNTNGNFTTDHINSTRLALGAFLRAVSTVLPTILWVDDILWSDQDTLEVFKLLFGTQQQPSEANVFFCATFRDDEEPIETSTEAFTEWHKELKENLTEKNQLQVLSLKNLQVPDIQQFLADTQNQDDHQSLLELAHLLHTRTNGNLFYLIQMLENLCDLNLLQYQLVTGYAWTYSLQDIQRSTCISDNVGQLVCSRIGYLSGPVQKLLQLASCLGAMVDVRALEIAKAVFDLDASTDISELVREACQEMMLIPITDTTCKFSHDQIQAAAYGMIAIEDVPQIHWRIGQALLHHKTTTQNRNLTFACAHQLKRGLDLHPNSSVIAIGMTPNDRVAIANLGLVAGQNAAGMSAFGMASDFFKLGIDALEGGGTDGSNAFQTDYRLAVKLYSFYARAEQCGGSIEKSKKAAETILAHTSNQADTFLAHRTLLSCFLAANQIDELIDFGLGLCEQLGEPITKNPKPRQLKRLVESQRKVLIKTSNAQILSLKPIQDKNKKLCMNVLFELSMPAYYVGNHPLHYAIANRMNKITLEYGLSKWSPKGFALSGQHFTANYSDFKEGHRYAQLALILLGDYRATKSGGGVLFHVAIIRTCMEPATASLDLLLDGYRMSMEVGNINFAFVNIFNYFWTYFYSGLPFGPLLDDIEKFSTQMLDYKRHYMFLMALPVWQCLLNLSGRAKDRAVMEGGEAMEKEALAGGNPKGAGRQTMMSYWMQLSFYLGNMTKATELYDQVKGFDMGAFKATMFFNARIFFFALIEIHNYRETKKRQCRKNATKYRDMLRKHVAGGAINLVHKVQLLEAEIMKRTRKNTSQVLGRYQAAIVSATRAGFLQDAALSNYLCAQYCKSVEVADQFCTLYLERAHEQYTAWGATAVAESVQERHPKAFGDSSSKGSDRVRSFGGHRSSCKFSDLGQDFDETSTGSGGKLSLGFHSDFSGLADSEWLKD